jgi:pimeloyl-ACP methyl ester carboxylesterase
MNPVDEARALKTVQQLHFIGGKDQVVPASVAHSYLKQLSSSETQLILLPHRGHHGWSKDWSQLLTKYVNR